jgi:hypothetical protein
MSEFAFLNKNSSHFVCILASGLIAGPALAADSQMAKLDFPPRLQSQAAGQAESANPVADDSNNVFRAVYDLKADGWSATPLKIESVHAPNTTSVGNASPRPLSPALSGNETLQLLAEFGAREYAQKTFSADQRRIIVNVYRFETSDGAFGAYLALRKGSSTLVLKGDATSQDDRSISFWKDKYFVSLAGTSPEDEESMLIMTGFASKLANAIKNRSMEPQLLNRIPILERVRGSEKIVMGPVSIRKAFPAPFAGTLCTEKILDGVVADYQMQEPNRERVKLLLARFASPESANKAYAAYLSPLEEQHKPQSFDNSLSQANLFKVSSSFLLVQLKGSEVLVITGARKKSTLPALAHSVY